MKKQILNIGKVLSRDEQKEIFGGDGITPGEAPACVQLGALCAMKPVGEHDKCCNDNCVSSTGYGTWGLCKAA